MVSIQQAVQRQVWRSAVTSAIVGGTFDGTGQAGAVGTQEAYAREERITVE